MFNITYLYEKVSANALDLMKKLYKHSVTKLTTGHDTAPITHIFLHLIFFDKKKIIYLEIAKMLNL